MSEDEFREIHKVLDEINRDAFKLANDKICFVENWFLVANAGGATASIGFLGALADYELELF